MRLEQNAQLTAQSEWPQFLGHPVQPTECGDRSVSYRPMLFIGVVLNAMAPRAGR